MTNKYFLNGFEGKNHLWRYIIMIIAVFVAIQIGSIPYAIIALIKAMSSGVEINSSNLNNFKLLGIDSNLGLFLMLLSFSAGLVALWFLIKPIHNRKIKTVLTTRKNFDWNRFLFASVIWGLMMIISLGISYLSDPSEFHFQFNAQAFVILLLISVLFLSLQSAFEEILFRGYFQQGLAVLTKNTWIPIIITSFAFGLLHAMNPEVKEFGVGIMLPQYIILGLALAILVTMDDGLELAIGVHVTNNVLSALVLTHESFALQTSALFKVDSFNPVASLYAIIIASILIIVIMKYKYKWSSFRKLIAKVSPEKHLID